MKPFQVGPVPLVQSHDVSRFNSGEPVLDDWLQNRALRNEANDASRTYVVVIESRVVGYYSIASTKVSRSEVPKSLARNMPEDIPATLLGRLAVDVDFQGLGIGKGLLKDALILSKNSSRFIASKLVLVHAISADAVRFYEANGFVPFPDDPRTLCVSMRSI